MFKNTKARVDTFVNDRVSAPIRTAVTIAVIAFLMAGIALLRTLYVTREQA